jgi:phytanoyl-CoA hydroxylase
MGGYTLSEEERLHFREHGYVHLRGVLTPDEVKRLSDVYDRFLRRAINVPGKDLNDMAGDYGRSPDDYRYVLRE